ncbi:MAG: response regulator [Acidobacteriia bacterium]|nr:response regulator [Terriglobia bacterium]
MGREPPPAESESPRRPARPGDGEWIAWFRYLLDAGWHPLDLDGIPSYSKRHKRRVCALLLASCGMLAGWIYAHRVVAPDIAGRSLLLLGGGVIPHTLLVVWCVRRLKPSLGEYAVMPALAVAYGAIQYLFSLSRSEAAPYLLAGTCVLFLILSNLMMRLRVGNAAIMSVFLTLTGVWLFAHQGSNPQMILCCAICASSIAASTLYLNFFIGAHEMYYIRQEQHFGLVLSGGKRDLWEFDSVRRVFHHRPWNAIASEASIAHSYEEYMARVHPGHRLELARAIEESLAGRVKGFSLECLVQLPGQSEPRWIHLVGQADQRGAAGAATRLIGTACDITARKALHAQVEEKSRELEEAARQKAEFLATMSHSIRTPLNAVIGAASVLSMDHLCGEAREMVETIQGSGHLLLTVLNDVLDAGAFYQGLPRLEFVSFDPAQVVRHCFDLIGPLAARKNLDLRCSCSPELRSRLSGDPVRLQQVLINLLSNAIKFTDRGSVSLSVAVETSSDSGIQAVTFAVTDTGIGIDEHAQRSLFERFEQVHRQTASSPAGTGLGLAISKRLVEAMGGDIQCHSKPGAGSRFAFTVRLPVVEEAGTGVSRAASAAGPANPVATPASPLETAKVRALIAEDNLVNQRLLARMLQHLNCEIHTAANGADAVEVCQQRSFDVIFMDCDMPVLDGLEATRRIRKLPQFTTVPIIAATAHALPANLDACFAAGMSDILTKPITLGRLTAVLEQWAGGCPESLGAEESACTS